MLRKGAFDAEVQKAQNRPDVSGLYGRAQFAADDESEAGGEHAQPQTSARGASEVHAMQALPVASFFPSHGHLPVWGKKADETKGGGATRRHFLSGKDALKAQSAFGAKMYHVTVERGVTTHSVVVRARSFEEAGEEAARVLGMTEFPIEMTIKEREAAE